MGIGTFAQRENYPFIKSWVKKDEGLGKYFVYILGLANGRFFAGQTTELHRTLLEHKINQIAAADGEMPKLSYFEIQPNREEAVRREHELKMLIMSNLPEVLRIVRNFHDLISQVDLT